MAVGWSVLRDPSVGFAIGVPAKFVEFGTPLIDGGALYYAGDGAIRIGDRHPPRLP